jgi:hypothetical protein
LPLASDTSAKPAARHKNPSQIRPLRRALAEITKTIPKTRFPGALSPHEPFRQVSALTRLIADLSIRSRPKSFRLELSAVLVRNFRASWLSWQVRLNRSPGELFAATAICAEIACRMVQTAGWRHPQYAAFLTATASVGRKLSMTRDRTVEFRLPTPS